MSECSCSCHKRAEEAAEKRRIARENKTWYYYHCDCYCCLAAYMPSFGLLLKEEKNDAE